MEINLLAFGIAKDIVSPTQRYQLANSLSVGDFKDMLLKKYPALGRVPTLRIAVNEEFASDELKIKNDDTVAIIPPVSGG